MSGQISAYCNANNNNSNSVPHAIENLYTRTTKLRDELVKKINFQMDDSDNSISFKARIVGKKEQQYILELS